MCSGMGNSFMAGAGGSNWVGSASMSNSSFVVPPISCGTGDIDDDDDDFGVSSCRLRPPANGESYLHGERESPDHQTTLGEYSNMSATNTKSSVPSLLVPGSRSPYGAHTPSLAAGFPSAGGHPQSAASPSILSSNLSGTNHYPIHSIQMVSMAGSTTTAPSYSSAAATPLSEQHTDAMKRLSVTIPDSDKELDFALPPGITAGSLPHRRARLPPPPWGTNGGNSCHQFGSSLQAHPGLTNSHTIGTMSSAHSFSSVVENPEVSPLLDPVSQNDNSSCLSPNIQKSNLASVSLSQNISPLFSPPLPPALAEPQNFSFRYALHRSSPDSQRGTRCDRGQLGNSGHVAKASHPITGPSRDSVVGVVDEQNIHVQVFTPKTEHTAPASCAAGRVPLRENVRSPLDSSPRDKGSEEVSPTPLEARKGNSHSCDLDKGDKKESSEKEEQRGIDEKPLHPNNNNSNTIEYESLSMVDLKDVGVTTSSFSPNNGDENAHRMPFVYMDDKSNEREETSIADAMLMEEWRSDSQYRKDKKLEEMDPSGNAQMSNPIISMSDSLKEKDGLVEDATNLLFAEPLLTLPIAVAGAPGRPVLENGRSSSVQEMRYRKSESERAAYATTARHLSPPGPQDSSPHHSTDATDDHDESTKPCYHVTPFIECGGAEPPHSVAELCQAPTKEVTSSSLLSMRTGNSVPGVDTNTRRSSAPLPLVPDLADGAFHIPPPSSLFSPLCLMKEKTQNRRKSCANKHRLAPVLPLPPENTSVANPIMPHPNLHVHHIGPQNSPACHSGLCTPESSIVYAATLSPEDDTLVKSPLLQQSKTTTYDYGKPSEMKSFGGDAVGAPHPRPHSSRATIPHKSDVGEFQSTLDSHSGARAGYSRIRGDTARKGKTAEGCVKRSPAPPLYHHHQPTPLPEKNVAPAWSPESSAIPASTLASAITVSQDSTPLDLEELIRLPSNPPHSDSAHSYSAGYPHRLNPLQGESVPLSPFSKVDQCTRAEELPPNPNPAPLKKDVEVAAPTPVPPPQGMTTHEDSHTPNPPVSTKVGAFTTGIASLEASLDDVTFQEGIPLTWGSSVGLCGSVDGSQSTHGMRGNTCWRDSSISTGCAQSSSSSSIPGAESTVNTHHPNRSSGSTEVFRHPSVLLAGGDEADLKDNSTFGSPLLSQDLWRITPNRRVSPKGTMVRGTVPHREGIKEEEEDRIHVTHRHNRPSYHPQHDSRSSARRKVSAAPSLLTEADRHWESDYSSHGSEAGSWGSNTAHSVLGMNTLPFQRTAEYTEKGEEG